MAEEQDEPFRIWDEPHIDKYESMPPEHYKRLVLRIAEAARVGILVSEELYQEARVQIPVHRNDESNEAIALSVRQLGPFCDWREFGWANDLLNAGSRIDDLHLVIQRRNAEEASWSPESVKALSDLARNLERIHKDQGCFLQRMRDAETLMGFDEEVTNKLVAILGAWDKMAVPNSLLDLLPEEVTFPLHKAQRTTPYDHRLHLLVRELVFMIGAESLSDEVVIRQCGHILADLLHADDGDAASRLILKQVTLLADDFVRLYPWNILGLCWRGELACWGGEKDLAEEYAKRVWNRTAELTSNQFNVLTSFFSLTTYSADVWETWGWDRLNPYPKHLGEIEITSGGLGRPLALKVVRRAFERGDWDTSMLHSTFGLMEEGCWLESDDLPVECWVWMAEHSEHSRFGAEYYYAYWCEAYKALRRETDPQLAHNVLVVLLTGLLLNKMCSVYVTPSIQQLLTGLMVTHQADSTTHKQQATLEMVRYIYNKLNLEHLTAGDRLAITNVIALMPRLSSSLASDESSEDTTDEQISPILLDQVEVQLRPQIGESHWSRLSHTAKNEFKHGEFLYIMASKVEGEGGNFDSFILHYSKGLLAEIQESLQGPLVKDPSLKREFHEVFSGEGHPEWGELLRFVNNSENVAKTKLGRHLMSQRVELRRLKELSDFFEKMRTLRNRAAHTGVRINRDEAVLLHGLLLDKEMIRRVVEYFPKPPRR